jgi:Divergent InlB B-repeat domain
MGRVVGKFGGFARSRASGQRVRRQSFLAAAVVLALLGAVLTAPAGAAGSSLQGEQVNPNSMLFEQTSGPANPTGCDPTGTSNVSFGGTGTATGPFAGQMTYSGTFSLGAQQYTVNPETGPLTSDPIYGFPANYGVLQTVTGSFSVTNSGVQTISGSFTGLAPPLNNSIGQNIGSCYGVGAGDAFGYTGLTSAALIAMDAHVNYTAVSAGETITGQLFMRERQTCQTSSSPGCGYSGLFLNFYSPSASGVALTVNKAGAGSGTVASSPSGISCGATCSASFDTGSMVTLTPTADAGSIFAGWSGACAGTGACVVTMDAAKSVTAAFDLLPVSYALTVSKTGTGSGSVASSPPGISCGATCSAAFVSGTSVTLTPTADPGSDFTGWTGACSGTGACVVPMDAAKSASAAFDVAPTRYLLTVTQGGGGTGIVASSPTGISCGATCSSNFVSATSVTLSPTANAGSVFIGWTGACTGTGVCVVTMDAAKSVHASFDSITPGYQQMTVHTGNGGSVSISPDVGFTCAANCGFYLATGTSATFTPIANPDFVFTGWSGDCTGTGPCVLTMNTPKSVTTTFAYVPPTYYSLTITKAGTGTGTVTSSDGVSCGATCTATYVSGTIRTLTPTASTGSVFTGWSGACSGTGTCAVTIDLAKSVTANFDLLPPPSYALTVSKLGAGTGSVASIPSGILCGTTCSATFVSGTSLTLTPTASAGSVFSGWSGACTGSGSCAVSMDVATNVTANFALLPVNYALSVSKAGAGSGNVASTPAGISCGVTCTASYASGTIVTLAPSASAGSVFSGWSGACTGTGPCVVAMNAAKSVTATFALVPLNYALAVSKAGTGAGTVASTPSGISCGATCSATYPTGTSVTLTPSANTGSVFSGWSGACSGAGSCVVAMNAAKSVSATFTAYYPITVNASGLPADRSSYVALSWTGFQTKCFTNGGSSDPLRTCTWNVITPGAVVTPGMVVTLTAVTTGSIVFTNWGGACSGITTTCTVTMSQAQTVNANFATVPPAVVPVIKAIQKIVARIRLIR